MTNDADYYIEKLAQKELKNPNNFIVKLANEPLDESNFVSATIHRRLNKVEEMVKEVLKRHSSSIIKQKIKKYREIAIMDFIMDDIEIKNQARVDELVAKNNKKTYQEIATEFYKSLFNQKRFAI